VRGDKIIVADPDHFDTDPNFAFHFDPGTAFHFDIDLDPTI
jgi:hypothetical protein